MVRDIAAEVAAEASIKLDHSAVAELEVMISFPCHDVPFWVI